MKQNFALLFLLTLFAGTLFAQQGASPNGDSGRLTSSTENQSFSDWFDTVSLRVDYYLAGDSSREYAFFREMRREPYYGGPVKNLTETFGYGSYRYEVYDSATNRLLYARGFNSLFQEWKGTPEAGKFARTFPMSAVMPFPKHPIRFVIQKRAYETNEFEPVFTRFIHPDDYAIYQGTVPYFPSTLIFGNGSSSDHVDVAFLAEGYTIKEMEKFRSDAKRMVRFFLSQKPYDEFADDFNFYAIESPSEQSGVTIPGKGTYINTNIRSSFYTFDMDRYLTTFDTKSMYDLAALVPYDMIFVLVNSSRYGGGGFFNHYGQSTVDHKLSEIVALHEFGHQFAGLGDEYYTAQVTYTGFYNLAFEPWEPNITTNVRFDTKWKPMIERGVPLPTPREELYRDKVGLFEGGGYSATGIFSPVMDCRMKTNEAPGFCPVCSEAIRRMIRYYTGK